MSRRILVVDDSLAIRTFIIKTLGANVGEFELVTANDGAQGLQLAEETKPDLILLDYILPDINGDIVCERLLTNPATSGTGVVLMSSNVEDIKRTTAAYANVIKSIAKPFTPQLLGDTVRQILREKLAPLPLSAASSPEPAPEPSRGIAFAGNSDGFPLHRALLAIQRDQLTGVLRIHPTQGQGALEIYAREGGIAVATTRDVEGSFKRHPFQFHVNDEQAKALEEAKRTQAETGCPVFLSLSRAGMVRPERAAGLCREYGQRLAYSMWTAGRVSYEFENMAELPEFVLAVANGSSPKVEDWMLSSLRHVGDECLDAIAWGDLTGIPIYTREGYERISQIPVTEEEALFLGQIGEVTLQGIANRLSISAERAQRILYRFLCLGIFEYWPAALFHSVA
jgi:CheY-like chemotaxis protein